MFPLTVHGQCSFLRCQVRHRTQIEQKFVSISPSLAGFWILCHSLDYDTPLDNVAFYLIVIFIVLCKSLKLHFVSSQLKCSISAHLETLVEFCHRDLYCCLFGFCWHNVGEGHSIVRDPPQQKLGYGIRKCMNQGPRRKIKPVWSAEWSRERLTHQVTEIF